MGLTRGFMYAGAARVLVSLWSVDDRARTPLMRRFYQAMRRAIAGFIAQRLQRRMEHLGQEPIGKLADFLSGTIVQLGQPSVETV